MFSAVHNLHTFLKLVLQLSTVNIKIQIIISTGKVVQKEGGGEREETKHSTWRFSKWFEELIKTGMKVRTI